MRRHYLPLLAMVWLLFFMMVAVVFAVKHGHAADLTPEDYQSALTEANSIITGLTTRAQQLAIQIAQQSREITRLKASAEGATKTAPKPTEPSHP